jgi:hypothetical protein
MADLLICSVADCGKAAYANSYCHNHYRRFRKYGDPLFTKIKVGKNHCGKTKCPAAVKICAHIYRKKNFEKRAKDFKEWKSNNLEYYKIYKKEYRERDYVRCASRKSNAANLKRRIQAANYRSSNRQLLNSLDAKRRATKKKAMPKWLTPDQILQINSVYAEAKRLGTEAGIPYHVDHIVPLDGKIVCGLHVPWNLRAIPAAKNLTRPKIYKDGME